MVYTPSALTLGSALRANIGDADDLRPRGRDGMDLGNPAEPVRPCEISYLRGDGTIGTARPSVPAHPVFDSAFSAFARGTLIATTRGPVAIEDLDPGMKVVTNERGPSPVLWIGCMTWPQPSDGIDPGASRARLTRIQTGALGLGRPLADVVVGPGARIAQRRDGNTGAAHTDQIMRPLHEMTDGMHVIALSPPGDLELYHIALRRHATITAAGLGFETYHPGPGFETQLTQRQLGLFISLFPHLMRPSDFGGLAHPRAPLGTGGRAIA
ncbi:Hint domain-containing protein [Roseovarius sp. S4756]|uniref:Hint domain-containing protein n=1 Tax=Roseovarius maritimus TaxID=3342637 RepID=UPI0037291239